MFSKQLLPGGGEFQIHILANDCTYHNDLIWSNGSQRDGPLSGIPDLLSNPMILMVHNHAKYSNYSQRDGCFLGS